MLFIFQLEATLANPLDLSRRGGPYGCTTPEEARQTRKAGPEDAMQTRRAEPYKEANVCRESHAQRHARGGKQNKGRCLLKPGCPNRHKHRQTMLSRSGFASSSFACLVCLTSLDLACSTLSSAANMADQRAYEPCTSLQFLLNYPPFPFNICFLQKGKPCANLPTSDPSPLHKAWRVQNASAMIPQRQC